MSLSIVDANGCQSFTTEFDLIKVNKVPIADFEADITYSCSSSETINFTNNSLNGSVYLWDFDNGMTSSLENPVIEFNNIGNYNVFLTAVSEFGCEDEMIKQVYIHPEYTIFVPSAFTPDGDGINDIFTAKGNAVESSEMQVYDRWGGIVFVSNSIDYGWDGKNVSGDWANNGFYLYQIATFDRNGRLWVYNGELNLMR